MKTLRTLLAVAALTCVFAHAALADDGIIHGDAPSAPPPENAAAPAPAPATTSDDATLTDVTVALVR
ncbi:MAG: hypothetical protein LC746_17615, partial [Acidobacteria bacterium]|nr:hypothetical protein [Acidobacteriota bacterium]